MKKEYTKIIGNLFKVDDISKFSRSVISLEAEDEFDYARDKDKNIEKLFNLCILYLDKEITNKQDIEQQIIRTMKNFY